MNWFYPKNTMSQERKKEKKKNTSIQVEKMSIFLHVKLLHTTRLNCDACPLMEVSLFLSVMLWTLYFHTWKPQQKISAKSLTTNFCWVMKLGIHFKHLGYVICWLPTWLRGVSGGWFSIWEWEGDSGSGDKKGVLVEYHYLHYQRALTY